LGKGEYHKMLISASIIVKNEEKIIQRCLDCVSLFADEIVVVDTGSTDKTKEIAERHPKVRLFDSEHFSASTHYSEFSFSIAKNEALKQCKGKWVVWFDADDFIDEENAKKIRNLAINTNEVCLFTFTIKYGPLIFEHCRMLRNGNKIWFDEGHSVHEYLNTSGYPNYSNRDIEIIHLPGIKEVPSGMRNIAIMENDYNKRGMDDQRTLFYLANGYRESGRYEDAIEFYKKYLMKSEWAEERFFARYFTAQSYKSIGNIDKARKEALRACAEDFRFAEAYCLLGDLAFKEGDAKRAQSWFQMASDTPFPKDAKLFVSKELYNSYPSSRIKDCHNFLVSEPSVSNGKVVEYTAKLKRVMGVFELPEEDNEALMAGGVLSAIAKFENGVFEIVNNSHMANKLIQSSDVLFECIDKNVALSLILPPNLNGRTREEWYGRAIGYVIENWEPIVNESRRVVNELGGLNAN
jgi:glycosyltransferase involved in cell wall biosynthesis